MPLGGIRVVDLSDRLSGAFAARLFGDFGADVVLAAVRDGHLARRGSPAIQAYVDWNKRPLWLDAAAGTAPDASLDELMGSADVVITTGREQGLVDRLGPSAVHLSITAHGLTGPLAATPGNHLTACARTGWTTVNAYEGEEPLQLPVRTTDYLAGVNGFIVAAAALHRRNRTGLGEAIDVSELEVTELTVGPWALASVFRGVDTSHGPMGIRTRERAGPLYPASDGAICLGFGDWKNWPEAMAEVGLDEFADDPALVPDFGRHQQNLRPVAERARAAVAGRERWPLFHRLGALRCLAGCLQTATELLDDEQLAARSFFVSTMVGDRTVRAPGLPVLTEPPLDRQPSPAPSPTDVHVEPGGPPLSWVDERDPAFGPEPAHPAAGVGRDGRHVERPLAGTRALTFTQAWSGTLGTELLALLGADVIQIELLDKSDVWRNTGAAVPDGVADPGRRQIPQNTQGLYNSVNLNKRAIALDMTSDRGRELFWRLVPRFDIVAENFAPHVMPRWGITLRTLAERRPDVIYGSISGFGGGGPYSLYPANGSSIEPMSGLSAIHGYPGDEGMNTGGLLPDPVAAHFFAAAVVAALHRRDRSGGPQRIDISMMETVTALIGDAVIEADAAGQRRRPAGNRHPSHAPHGIYACAGGEWVALAAEGDEAWAAFAPELDLDADNDLATAPGRKAAEDRLDQAIADWTSARPASEAAAKAVAAGLCAAPVATPTGVFTEPNPHLAIRGFLTTVDHPESGRNLLMGAPWKLAKTPTPRLRPSPCVGEHSLEVLTGELGLTESEYADLVAEGVTGTL